MKLVTSKPRIRVRDGQQIKNLYSFGGRMTPLAALEFARNGADDITDVMIIATRKDSDKISVWGSPATRERGAWIVAKGLDFMINEAAAGGETAR